MKIIYSILSFLIVIPITCYAQNKIAIELCRRYDKTTTLPHTYLVKVLELNPKVDNLLKLNGNKNAFAGNPNYNKEIITGHIASILGYIASTKDKNAIQFLDSLIYFPTYPDGVAINSIFRIGGKPMARFLDTLFAKNDFKFQYYYIKHTWVIDKLSDLEIIEAKVHQVMKKHPEWKINKYLSKSYLPKLNIALKILRNKDKAQVQQEIKDILEGKNKIYWSFSGGYTKTWAIKMLIKTCPPENKAEIYHYLLERKNYLRSINKSNSFSQNYLFYLHLLGYQLSPQEGDFMKKTASISGSYRVFRSKEEVLEYYNFRKKYPFKPY